MDDAFRRYQNTNARVVSSWLHEIPSDAGGGSEATLIEPSMYEQATPRRRKDEPRTAKPKTPAGPAADSNARPSPARNSIPNATPATPARLPIRPRPNPDQTRPQPPNPAPPSPSPASPTRRAAPPPNRPLRETIILNFAAHCLHCQGTSTTISPPLTNPINTTTTTTTNDPANTNRPTNPCPRCAPMSAYARRAHHKPAFLASHLLPISEVLSFDECVAYLNQAVAARLAGVLARRRGDAARGTGRTWPTLDDFDFVRAVARERRAVLEGMGALRAAAGAGLGRDRFGMLRDRDG